MTEPEMLTKIADLERQVTELRRRRKPLDCYNECVDKNAARTAIAHEQDLLYKEYHKRVAEGLDGYQREIGEWGAATFANSTQESILAHFAEEAIELVGLDIMREAIKQKSQLSLWPKSIMLNKPDMKEMPDLFLLLLRLAEFEGVSLMQMAQAKMEINKTRKWADTDGRGYAKHVEE